MAIKFIVTLQRGRDTHTGSLLLAKGMDLLFDFSLGTKACVAGMKSFAILSYRDITVYEPLWLQDWRTSPTTTIQ